MIGMNLDFGSEWGEWGGANKFLMMTMPMELKSSLERRDP